MDRVRRVSHQASAKVCYLIKHELKIKIFILSVSKVGNYWTFFFAASLSICSSLLGILPLYLCIQPTLYTINAQFHVKSRYELFKDRTKYTANGQGITISRLFFIVFISFLTVASFKHNG